MNIVTIIIIIETITRILSITFRVLAILLSLRKKVFPLVWISSRAPTTPVCTSFVVVVVVSATSSDVVPSLVFSSEVRMFGKACGFEMRPRHPAVITEQVLTIGAGCPRTASTSGVACVSGSGICGAGSIDVRSRLRRSRRSSGDGSGGGVGVDLARIVTANHGFQIAFWVPLRTGHLDPHDIFSNNGPMKLIRYLPSFETIIKMHQYETHSQYELFVQMARIMNADGPQTFPQLAHPFPGYLLGGIIINLFLNN
jgi:hypothetical protein